MKIIFLEVEKLSEFVNDPMLEAYIFETSQQVELLEQSVINAENNGSYSPTIVNEIFRIMHTIKGSSAMMLFNNISTVAHHTEDLFYFLRENKPEQVDASKLCDLVLEGIDFVKLELEKIKNGDQPDGNEEQLLVKLKEHLVELKEVNGVSNVSDKNSKATKKQFYISPNKSIDNSNINIFKVNVRFQSDCEMENIRAYMIVHNLQDITTDFHFIPSDVTDNNDSAEIIKKDGFTVYLKTEKTVEEMTKFFDQVAFLDKYELIQIQNSDEYENNREKSNLVQEKQEESIEKEVHFTSSQQSKIISVNVQKLDTLMDLVGEMVISEAMVTQNPDLRGLNLDNFQKAARQLRKITSEIQDVVMSIRMVPLGPTFFKMNRIVRDMSKNLSKDTRLEIIGEDTEVDKNIIDNLGDPLMHLVRNSLDHGIESADERVKKGKPREGTITLEARNAGSEVLVIIKDDGKGLNKEKILAKAMENGLLTKPAEEMVDREIFNLIFLPGFSTKEAVTEYSGRGVGMDVVTKNIEAVGGSIHVESIENEGSTFTIKIPLTLAIIDGMNIKVGESRYTLPITSIKESFRPKEDEVFKDPSGNEMIMIRGGCYPVRRLNEFYKVKTDITDLHKGILIMVEHEHRATCLFVDELIGEQQVVVKALPDYIKKIKKIQGVAGCTLLGDGSISLILDVDGLTQ
ncbi:MAG: chemotaxis protein CheA [Bacillales bacterium]|jgi:two-component system chemotaxis sensor kinase CheA|nr:chemotaxis protein CheA [Bacillales bacterium]